MRKPDRSGFVFDNVYNLTITCAFEPIHNIAYGEPNMTLDMATGQTRIVQYRSTLLKTNKHTRFDLVTYTYITTSDLIAELKNYRSSVQRLVIKSIELFCLFEQGSQGVG